MFRRIHALPFEKLLKHFVNKKASKEVFHESYYLCQNVKTKLNVNYISKAKIFDIKIIYLGTLTSLSGGLSSAIGNVYREAKFTLKCANFQFHIKDTPVSDIFYSPKIIRHNIMSKNRYQSGPYGTRGPLKYPNLPKHTYSTQSCKGPTMGNFSSQNQKTFTDTAMATTIPESNSKQWCSTSGPKVIKHFFKLSSAEHEISTAHTC